MILQTSTWMSLLFVLGAPHIGIASDFYVRTQGSSPREFKEFLSLRNRPGYVDWRINSLDRETCVAGQLDSALEIAATDPEKAISFFENSIESIQGSILNESCRNLITAIRKRVLELKVTESVKHGFWEALKPWPQSNELERHDFMQTTHRVRTQAGFEEAVILLNGESIPDEGPKYWPKTRQQWSLLSNTFLPIVFIGTWTEFQAAIKDPIRLKPFANGTCGELTFHSLIQESLVLRTKAGIFASATCHSDVEQSPIAQHLGQPKALVSSETKPLWIIPIGILVGVGLAASLKDKKVSVGLP